MHVNNEPTKYRVIKRLQGDNLTQTEDCVIREDILNIYVNGRHYSSQNYTPGDEINLAVGFLVSQGLLEKHEDLLSAEMATLRCVKVMIAPHAVERIAEKMALSSGCGGGRARLSLYKQENVKRIEVPLSLDPKRIADSMKIFSRQSELFKVTGGAHSCALYNAEGEVIMKEDIGRHNAADKVIGACFLNEIPMGASMLFTTGRVSGDILLKAVQAQIPMVVSLSAPTDLAIQLAEWANITLVGFVRGERMNVYTEGKI